MLFQFPNGGKTVDCVAGEAAHAFCDDQIDFPSQSVFHHLIETFTVTGTRPGDSFIRVDLYELPCRIALDVLCIVIGLRLEAGKLLMNTTRLYNAIHNYQVARADARDAFIAKKRSLANAAGSRMYNEEIRKAWTEREEIVAAAQRIARAEMREIETAMMEKARMIPLDAPTDEMIRILQMLQMKEKTTMSELNAAANAMNGNASALRLLDEIARKTSSDTKVLFPSFTVKAAKKYDSELAIDKIKEIFDLCANVINETTGANPVRLMGAQYHKNHYNAPFDPDDLPAAQVYQDESEFWKDLGVDECSFSNAVD